MAWVVGVDEAGYGPNLGPFVMTAVACRVPGDCTGDLWELLAAAVRRAEGEDDDRLIVDDSKAVYAPKRGLAALERGVLACLGPPARRATLGDFADWLCPECLPALRAERWYRGDWPLPATDADLDAPAAAFARCCEESGGLCWAARAVVVCPQQFNAVTTSAGSKGAVLADSLGQLLRWGVTALPAGEPARFVVDKHGGRNAYAASLQHGLPGGMVVAREEGAARSSYEVVGLGRPLALTFQPRADREHFCVALASMASKYLRELLMLEFNRFWCGQVPGLKPTAGYPGDSSRFFAAIQPALERLGLPEEAVWRRR